MLESKIQNNVLNQSLSGVPSLRDDVETKIINMCINWLSKVIAQVRCTSRLGGKSFCECQL